MKKIRPKVTGATALATTRTDCCLLCGASNNPAHSSPAHGLSNRNSQEPGSHNSPEHGNSPSNPSNRQHGSSRGLECLPDGNSLSQECRASKDL